MFPCPCLRPKTEQKTFVTHTGGVITTSGEVIDPMSMSNRPWSFDPMEYLRDFNYGKVSQTLDDGTTLREFTIIAEDDKVMEVSPGVFL